LMSETQRLYVKVEESPSFILVDYELFATALKNLLDNALKHSSDDVWVSMKEHSIDVQSFGPPLAHEQLNFARAFNRQVEGSLKGLGLGLYIANAIVTKHGYALLYSHTEGINKFTISFG